MNHRHITRSIVHALSAVLLLPALAPIARAAIVPTQAVIASAERDATLARVERALHSDALRAEFLRQGVSPAVLDTRLAGLSDAELTTLANRLDRQPAGGDGLLTVLGIVLVVMVVLDLTDTVHIFRHPAKSGSR